MLAAIRELVKRHGTLILDLGIVACAVLLGFALGRISRIEAQREPVRIIRASSTPAALVEASAGALPIPKPAQAAAAAGVVVASKGGTKYHYPWCGGAARISVANKVTFPSIEAARAKGYTPAANCPGLK